MRTPLSGQFCVCLASALLLVAGATACSDDDVIDVIDEGQDRGEALGGLATQEVIGADVTTRIAIATEIMLVIDDGVMAQAQAAVDQGTSDVGFADQLFDDHAANQDVLLTFLDSRGIAPLDSGVAADLRGDFEGYVRELEASGAAINETFLRLQIITHETALGVLDAFEGRVDDTQFQNILTDTIDMLEEHRDDAVQLYRGL